MAGYMTSAVVSASLDGLAAKYPTLCTRSGTSDWQAGWSGGKSGYVKIGTTTAGSPAQRWAALVTGGVHARELAPPDALVSFLGNLLDAYTAHSAVVYPARTDFQTGIVYDSFIVSWPTVRAIVERLDLYVAPLVNDDGRDWVLTPLPSSADGQEQSLHKMWRKNRRPAPAGVTDPHGVGVDLNRNFDIVWNFEKFYNMSIPDLGVHSSTNAVDDSFVGDVTSGSAESEPEVKNLANLMRTKNISFLLDVHQYARDVLFSWGIESNQSEKPEMNFANKDFDGQRDGVHHDFYKEYIPAGTAAVAATTAQFICDQILFRAGGSDLFARERSTYTAKPSAGLYVTTGSIDDYCFSRWFTAATAGTPISPVLAFTVEAGGDPKYGPIYDEGGFSPDYLTQYPKLEREIHVAAWAFLKMAAAKPFQPPAAPPASSQAPSPPAPRTGGGSDG